MTVQTRTPPLNHTAIGSESTPEAVAPRREARPRPDRRRNWALGSVGILTLAAVWEISVRTGLLASSAVPALSSTLADLVAVAGRRWTVEESFQTSKGLTGLDQHQVRTWTSWHRWSILVLLAHAFLAVQTATQRDTEHPNPTLIRLSINEFRRLFVALILTPLHHRDRILTWSLWRRRHQQRAHHCHQNRRSQHQ